LKFALAHSRNKNSRAFADQYSGAPRLRIPEGRHPRVRFRTLAGKLHCDCTQGNDFEIRAASVSGSIDIKQS